MPLGQSSVGRRSVVASLVLLPPSSEYMSLPASLWGPAPEARVIFCSPQFFPCHLLDEAGGTGMGPEALSPLVSVSKDI